MKRRSHLSMRSHAALARPRRDWLKRSGAWCMGALLSGAGIPSRAVVPLPSSGPVPHRIVTLSWELTETLLALGVAPIGTALPDWYRSTIVMPPLPAGVVDIGLLYQPNFDVLHMLQPDLFVITPGHASAKPSLERLAPTITLGAYMSDPDPYRALCDETVVLALRLQRQAVASALIEAATTTFDRVHASLTTLRSAPVIVADLIDDRHVRVYAGGSLFDQILAKLGIVNAANPRDGRSAWATAAGYATVPIQRLATVQHASVLLVGPTAAPLRAALARNAIWQALPAVRARRVTTLPVIAPYGGLVSMQRFAIAVQAALQRLATGGGDVA